MNDQAAALRQLAAERFIHQGNQVAPSGKIIVVSSGKGGVGKSVTSLHLAYLLSKAGYQTLLVDANLRTPSLHILSNIAAQQTLNNVLLEGLPFEKLNFQEITPDFFLLPNENTGERQTQIEIENGIYFLEQLQPYQYVFDYLIFDTQTGLTPWNLTLYRVADLILLLTLAEPTAIIDTYLLIKTALSYVPASKFHLVINQVLSVENGKDAFQKLNQALQNFLQCQIDAYHLIPFHMQIRHAVENQLPLWQQRWKGELFEAFFKLEQQIIDRLQDRKKLKNQTYQSEVTA